MHPSGVTSSLVPTIGPVGGTTHTRAGSEPAFPPVVPLTHTFSLTSKLVVDTVQFPTVRLWARASLGEDSDNKAIARIDMILGKITANRRGKNIDTSAN